VVLGPQEVPAYVDRAHQWTGASPTLLLPDYLLGGEYIMSGNDNRDNGAYQLDITVAAPSYVYMLVDDRLGDASNSNPPNWPDWTADRTGDGLPDMAWLIEQGWEPVKTGLNRWNDPEWPDHIGVDEGADGAGPGQGVNQWSSVYVKVVEAGTFSIYQPNNNGQNMYGVVIKTLPGSVTNPPEIANVVPANNTLFHNPAAGVSFKATTATVNNIPTANIALVLNGADVSADLVIGGNATNRTAAYGKLQADTYYRARIIVSDQAGRASTNDFTFDTFTAAQAIMIEAEDYDYDSGKFLDPAAPGGYAGSTGAPDVDYHNNNGTALATQYRLADYMGLAASGDVAREVFTSAGAQDFQVTQVQAGDWWNYTRAFNDGLYRVYLRASSAVAQQVRLDRFASEAPAAGQRVFALGTFAFSGQPGTTAFSYLPLSDAAGNPVVVRLSGATTLRLTALSANVNLVLNYLLLLPSTAPAGPAYVSSLSPAPGAGGVGPDAKVKVTLANGASAVTAGSVKLLFSGSDVTGAATVSTSADGATVTYDPPGYLALGTAYPVRVEFGDAGGGAYASEWTFTTVASLNVIPANFGTPPGSGQGDGFRLKMRKAPNVDWAGAAFTLANNAARAENQLADQLIDPNTLEPYVNEAGGPNGDGLATGTVVNFDQLAAPAGYFAGESPFPHVDPAVFADPNNLAMEATAYVELAGGIYRFGVRSDDGFRVTTGPVFAEATQVLGVYEGGRGAGLPGGATEFDFQVEAAGVYPLRLIWYEGNGGASLELYSVDRDTFTRTLLNDPNKPGAIKAYQERKTQIYVPAVTITSPTDGTTYPTGPTNLTVTADASVVNGQIAKVEFFQGGTVKIGEATGAPYRLAWNNVEAGRYTLTALATDAKGLSKVSAPVKITIGQPISVNFQNDTADPIEGYLPDNGEAFGDRGNGYNYGWDVDNVAAARNRNNVNSPDERYDTFNHLQKPLPAGRFWEIEVPNGRYQVYVVVGESNNIDSLYDLTAEGVTIAKGTPTDAVRWFDGQGIVTVTDGRLTLGNGPTASNNKVCFVDIFALPAELPKPVLAMPTISAGLVTVTWTNGGTLESAPTVLGPWTSTGDGDGAYTTTADGPSKFFRVKR
jgi:hypothetical protein